MRFENDPKGELHSRHAEDETSQSDRDVRTVLGCQSALCAGRALLLFAHRDDASRLASYVPLIIFRPDYHVTDTIVALFMASVTLLLAIRMTRRHTRPVAAFVLVKLALCLWLIADIPIAQPGYVEIPVGMRLIDCTLIAVALRGLLRCWRVGRHRCSR